MAIRWIGIALILGLGLVAMALLAAVVALVASLSRRNRYDQQRHERISRELERINAMAAANRITPEEAAELRQALLDQRPPEEAGPGRGRLQKSRSAVLAGVCGGGGVAALGPARFPPWRTGHSANRGVSWRHRLILALAMPQPGGTRACARRSPWCCCAADPGASVGRSPSFSGPYASRIRWVACRPSSGCTENGRQRRA